MARVHIDFETRSYADIRKVGAYEYSKHPSTVVLCMAWCVDDSPVYLWKAGDPLPVELFAWIEHGAEIAAHNAFFERCIWYNICEPKMGWTHILEDKWVCTLAKASVHALPRSLGECGKALGLSTVKDEEGSRVMLKLCKYRTPTKNNPSRIPGTHQEYITLYKYCMQDVEAERAIDKALRDLSPKENQLWLLDQRMNWSGVKIDRPAVFAALEHLSHLKEHFVGVITAMTGGEVTSFKQYAKLSQWCSFNGEPMDSVSKDAVYKKLLDPFMDEKVREVLSISQEAGKSSTAKYEALIQMSNTDDWRARGHLLYHGASTGRWTGKGIQMQNLARGIFGKKDDFEALVAELRTTPTLQLMENHPNIMSWMSSLIRSMIVAGDGKEFYVADYNAIEARVVLWLAGEAEALAGFDSGRGIYVEMASTLYNKDPEQIDPDGNERQLGKQVILGGGYGMGFFKFLITCKGYKIEMPEELMQPVIRRNYEDLKGSVEWWAQENQKQLHDADMSLGRNLHELMFCKQIITMYRQKFPRIVQFWADMEATAIAAVDRKGEVVQCGKLFWLCDDEFLWLRLPSGRKLAYREPLVKETSRWGRPARVLTFMGTGENRKWMRQGTYGGALVENATQAVARDLMAEAMLRLDAAGYPPVLTVHDEVISEKPKGVGNHEHFCELLSTRPEWAPDLPLKVAGWYGDRYKKG